MDTIPVSPPLPSSPAALSAEALAKEEVPPGGKKEDPQIISPPPTPHHSKRLWVLVGIGILTAGILVGSFGTELFNKSKDTSSLAPSPSQKDTSSYSQLAISPTLPVDPTEDWKTYTNISGYSIKYPLSFATQLLAAGAGDKEADITTRQLFIYQIGSKEPYLERFVNFETFTNDPANSTKTAIQTTINGYPAQKTSSPNAPFEVYSVKTPNNEFIQIYVSNDPSRKNQAHQILSTFRFLDAVSPTPTTTPLSTPVQSNGAEIKNIRYTLPASWNATTNADNLHLAPKSGGGYLNIDVFNYPGTTGRRDYYCQLHKYCIAETVFTETAIGNISGYKATRLDNSGGGSEYFGAKGNKFYIISTISPPSPNDFDAHYGSVISSLIF